MVGKPPADAAMGANLSNGTDRRHLSLSVDVVQFAADTALSNAAWLSAMSDIGSVAPDC